MPHPRPHFVALVLAGTLSLLPTLTGCSDDAEPTKPTPTTATSASEMPSPDGSPSTDDSPSPMPVSSLSATEPKAVATVDFTFAQRDDKPTARLSIGEVKSTPTGTRVTFWVNSSDDKLIGEQGLHPQSPEEYPTLVDPVTKVVYKVDTWTNASDLPAGCVCSGGPEVTTSTVHPQDASYGPLPENLETVQLTLPGAKSPVTVEVTR